MATSRHGSTAGSIPAVLDWLVALATAVGGVALVAAGSAVFAVVDSGRITEEMSAGEVTVVTAERTLSDAEAATLATDVLNWTATGLVVTGVGLAAFAVLYGVTRYRNRGRDGRLTTRQHGRHAAVCGAVATAVLSFLPFSPVFGGGVAAYLDLPDTDRAVRIGALAGGLAAVPAVVLLAFTTVGLYTGLSVVDDTWARVITVLSMGLGAVVTLAVSAGLGGVGGYVGDEVLAD